MTEKEIRDVVVNALGTIAPEADLDGLNPDLAFRDQLDIDSVDYLNFVIALHRELHVEIPERDYPKLATLRDCVRYLTSAVAVESRA